MPIYAYRCAACGHAKDVLQKVSDPVLSTCPACGAEAFRKQRSRYISYLSSTAQDKGDAGRDSSYGYGLVDAAKALAKSIDQANDSFN